MSTNSHARATWSPNAIQRDKLSEVYEAYQLFCDIGWHQVAWRNLYLALASYLSVYFEIQSAQLPRRPHSSCARYLGTLDIAEIEQAVSDIVYVLLRRSRYHAQDELETGPQARLSTLAKRNFHNLLLDLTNELNNCSTGYIPEEAWKRGHSNDTSIVDRLVVLTWNESVFFDELGVLREIEQKTSSLFNVPRRLLRRALSARTTSARPKRPTENPRPSTIAVEHLTHDAAKNMRPQGPSVVDMSGNAMYPMDQALPWPPGSPLSTDLQADSRLRSILEEDETQRSDTEDTLVWPDDDEEIIQASRASNASLSFDINSIVVRAVSKGSIKLAAKRSSIIVRDLDELDISGTLAIPHMLPDDGASTLSINRISFTSGTSRPSGHDSFLTAQSHVSMPDFATTRSGRASIDTFLSFTPTATDRDELTSSGPYQAMLLQRDLVPSPMVETNWSGRGQNTEYGIDERDSIPLLAEKILGQTRNALVESVRCKRVRLVRKTLRCNKWTGLKREDALQEVQHLYRVQHSHIVRLVGTYVIGPDLAILTYPCAEWNLEQFLRATRDAPDVSERCGALRHFFTCLAKVLDFMHSFPLKHMDIKPQNLLVRDVSGSSVDRSNVYKIYITDFGISRSYDSIEESETETPTSFTRAYAAMEVVLQESRGLSADIFSLGCVYAEMLATILDSSTTVHDTTSQWESLQAARDRTDIGTRPYHSAVAEVRTWLHQLPLDEPELIAVAEWTYKMIDMDSSQRPSARQIADDPHLPFACISCTLREGPEQFEAAIPASIEPP
ncbi:kinase-like protein [Polyplosphaeria fusca]|uniref:Kinase-like protein n=1 Tax=Polyplosphaeria fusca TaxID=682080 RepID=A0A9P4R1D4_9PLEO|nr:kinase-like protein [Polyplosphaeria fusca]